MQVEAYRKSNAARGFGLMKFYIAVCLFRFGEDFGLS